MKAKQRGVSLGGLLTWCVIIGVGASCRDAFLAAISTRN